MIEKKITLAIEAIRQVRNAFGAPGDYGYGSKEGDALFNLCKAQCELTALLTKAQPEK